MQICLWQVPMPIWLKQLHKQIGVMATPRANLFKATPHANWVKATLYANWGYGTSPVQIYLWQLPVQICL